jgi:hypothetical protein
MTDPPGLDEGQHFEELVERAEPTGKHDEPSCVAHEHELPGEEVVEPDDAVHIRVGLLLEGELDL